MPRAESTARAGISKVPVSDIEERLIALERRITELEARLEVLES